MEQEKKVIKVTRVGKGINVGYDDVLFLGGFRTNNGRLDIELSSNVLNAMKFNSDESPEMLSDTVSFVRSIIRNQVVTGGYDGRTSDYKVEISTLEIIVK
jgi:hypothetical protein